MKKDETVMSGKKRKILAGTVAMPFSQMFD